MAIKEYREFFLRATQVNTGPKLDQEVGFPTDYYVTINGVPTLVKNRFLKNHYPSEEVNKKLFESITFKLNPEDAASDTIQGLFRTAPDSDIPLRKTPNADYGNDGFVRAVQPHQIPEIVAGSNVSIVSSTVTDDGKTRQRYTINASVGSGTPTVEGEILLWSYYDSQTKTGPTGGNTEFTDFTGFFIPQGTLEIGDTIEIDVYVNNTINIVQQPSGVSSNSLKHLIITLGNTVLGLPLATSSFTLGFQTRTKCTVKLTVMNNTSVLCELIQKVTTDNQLLWQIGQLIGTSGWGDSTYFAKDQILTIPNHSTNNLDLRVFANIPVSGDLEMYALKVKLNKVRN